MDTVLEFDGPPIDNRIVYHSVHKALCSRLQQLDEAETDQLFEELAANRPYNEDDCTSLFDSIMSHGEARHTHLTPEYLNPLTCAEKSRFQRLPTTEPTERARAALQGFATAEYPICVSDRVLKAFVESADDQLIKTTSEFLHHWADFISTSIHPNGPKPMWMYPLAFTASWRPGDIVPKLCVEHPVCTVNVDQSLEAIGAYFLIFRRDSASCIRYWSRCPTIFDDIGLDTIDELESTWDRAIPFAYTVLGVCSAKGHYAKPSFDVALELIRLLAGSPAKRLWVVLDLNLCAYGEERDRLESELVTAMADMCASDKSTPHEIARVCEALDRHIVVNDEGHEHVVAVLDKIDLADIEHSSPEDDDLIMRLALSHHVYCTENNIEYRVNGDLLSAVLRKGPATRYDYLYKPAIRAGLLGRK